MNMWEGVDRTSLAKSMMACTSVEELSTLLEQRGIWLNREAAQTAYNEVERLRTGELSNEELAAVAGGARFYETFDMMTFLEKAVSKWL